MHRCQDVGSGPGDLALELAKLGATAVGVDISPNQIEAAKKRAKELRLDSKTAFAVATAGDAYLCLLGHGFTAAAQRRPSRRTALLTSSSPASAGIGALFL